MNAKFLNPPPVYSQAPADRHSTANLRQLLQKYVYHWPLFFLCLCITGGLAILYLLFTQPVYNVKAKFAIKDEGKSTAEKLALEDLNVNAPQKEVQSRVEVLKSRALIGRVVNDLQLWSGYHWKEGLINYDLFTTTPLRLRLIEASGHFSDHIFEVSIISPERFQIKKIDGSILEVNVHDQLSSDFGRWKLDTTSYIQDYIGKTIILTVDRPNKVLAAYQKNILTSLDKTAPVVSLSLYDKAPERGLQVLSHLIEAYKEVDVTDKSIEAKNTLKFLDDRLDSLSTQLNAAEQNVAGFKSSVGLTDDISSKSQYYLENVQQNDARLNEVNVQLNVIEGIEQYVNSNAEGNPPATIGIVDPGLVNLVDQLTRLQLQKERLLATTPEGNPLFVPLNKQINSTRAALKQNISGIKASLLTTQKQLMRFNSKFDASIRDIPMQERKFVSIKRDQTLKEELYVYLLQKREEVALGYASTLTDAHIIDEPYYDEPEGNKTVPLAAALLLGLLFPISIIHLRELFRNKVLTREDIEAETQAPIICELSHSDQKNKAIVVLDGERIALGEQMRVLRTNLLQVYGRKEKGKVTLFTSSISSEGKSFVAANIGASLAASGRKTIILELDLRQPEITRLFNMEIANIGLTNLLKGELGTADIILPSGLHPDLYVMKSGPIPENPSELLESPAMERLIQELREDYDNILIDSPPMHVVTDATILAQFCDVSLYIIRHNFTPKTELAFVDKVYRSQKLPNMNLVFNDVQMLGHFGYYMDYGYYTNKAYKNKKKPSVFSDFFKRF